MRYADELKKLDSIKQKIDQLLPLSEEANEKLWKKLRLEWNFNSNHIEGNTLTYFETQLLLLLGNTSGDHKVREYEEMKAHDVAVEVVKNWAGDKDRRITEKEIRELNKIILVSPFWKDAQTPDGSFTKREITPGEYKKYPNHVRLESGEIFKYAEPDEVRPQMKELMDWYHNTNELHPVEKAGLFHYKFIRIHPFDDGNGRIARLLMNYHLMKVGFAPVIIKSNDKKNYIFALNKADAGDVDSFVEYISNQSLWSMNVYLKAAKNENIEETEDWKKQLKIIKERSEEEPIKRNTELMHARIEDTVFPLLNFIDTEISEYFSPLFERTKNSIKLENIEIVEHVKKTNILPIISILPSRINNKIIELMYTINLLGYKKNGLNVFDIETKFQFDFNEYSYTFKSLENLDLRTTKGYKAKIEDFEMQHLVNHLCKFILNKIENQST